MKEFKLEGLSIRWHGHASFEIESTKKIYIDPYKIRNSKKDADIILISHEHPDHFSPEDIKKLVKEDTKIIIPPDCLSKLSRFVEKGKAVTVKKRDKLKIGEKITLEATPAYNINKFREPGLPFHPKHNDWVGFIMEISNIKIYFAGDTDYIPELRGLKNIDVAILPVSGTYVMTADEAAELVNSIHPKCAIPMHYGEIVGTPEDAERFNKLTRAETVILEKI